MSFPRYPKYKDSGVEWLGEVPEHWAVKRLKHCARLVTAKAEERANPVALENIEGWTGRLLPSEGDYQGEGTAFATGDILFGKLRPYLAKVHLATQPGEAVGDFHVLRPDEGFDGHFAQYHMLTREFIDIVDGSTYGSKMPRASWEFVGGMPMAVPPPVEQPAIAAFLDRETAKIDALIAQQQRLIALLQEKRQAVICHAVTKGLNPDAPMKDSGIEWLGEVPEHWDVLPVKYLVASIEQGWSPQCDGFPVQDESEWGVLKVGCVNGGVFNPQENKSLPPELSPIPKLGIASGDLLVSRANTRELVGSAAVADRDYPRLLLCDKVYRLRLDAHRCSPTFLSLFLASRAAREPIELGATGASASMVNIGQSVILNLITGVPPVAEQCAVVQHVADMLTRLNSLETEAHHAVTLLQERRSALISAAVTGQIDVRGLAGSEAA